MGNKILVVDDDKDIRVLLSNRLTTHGYEVAFAHDGVSCMKALREDSPDAIVLDLGLPAGNGFITLNRLRDDPDLCGIPVVVLTSDDSPESKARALESGAQAFLQKTASSETLMTTLSKIMDSEVAEI